MQKHNCYKKQWSSECCCMSILGNKDVSKRDHNTSLHNCTTVVNNSDRTQTPRFTI